MASAGVMALASAMPIYALAAPTAMPEITSVAEANQAAVIAPTRASGKVLFVRVQPSEPTPQEKAAQAALEEARQARAETTAKIEQYRVYSELQAQLAQARAEKEALAQTGQVTAAIEARLREETRREMARATEQTNTQLSALKETTAEALKAQTVVTSMKWDSFRESTAAQISSLAQATQAKDEATSMKWDSFRESTAAQIASLAQATQAQGQATSAQIEGLKKEAQLRLAAMESLTEANRRLTETQITRVAEELRNYASSQLAAYAGAVSSTLTEMAASQNMQTATLQKETSERLQELYANARVAAAQLAEQKAGEVAASVAKLQAETEAKRLTPQQVEVIAANTISNATPQFQALAIDTLRDAKGYIRSIARNVVTDADPAMQQALQSAAAKVITSDGKVAFAIRKAVLTELDNVTQAVSGTQLMSARTRLGDDAAIEPAAGAEQTAAEGQTTQVEEVALDATRLRLARLLAPRMEPTTPADNPTVAATLASSFPNGSASLQKAKYRNDLMDIRQYRVVVHEDQQTLPDIVGKILARAAPFAGPWEVKWKISEENKDILTEKFSLDAETTFDDFVSYLAQYLLNDRGVKVTFSLFDRERVMLVSD